MKDILLQFKLGSIDSTPIDEVLQARLSNHYSRAIHYTLKYIDEAGEIKNRIAFPALGTGKITISGSIKDSEYDETPENIFFYLIKERKEESLFNKPRIGMDSIELPLLDYNRTWYCLNNK